jgi:drug/metabolite transporter (DMT)-like permease
MTISARRRTVSYLLLTASMALVGSYVALSKPLVLATGVIMLAFLRFAIAAVAMAPWTLPRPAEPKLTRREHLLFFLMSFLGNFLFSLAMLNGMARTTATAAGVIMATLPAFVAIGSWLFLREQPSRRLLAAIAFSIGGIGLLQFARGQDDATHSATLVGNALVLASVVCEASYVIIGKRLAATRAPLRVSALVNLWGLVLIAPLGIWQWPQFDPASLSAPLWTLLVFYSLAASLFAVWLWMTGLRNVPAHHAGVFTVALPISATLVGIVFLGETFTPLHAAALALAIGGVLLSATAPHA